MQDACWCSEKAARLLNTCPFNRLHLLKITVNSWKSLIFCGKWWFSNSVSAHICVQQPPSAGHVAQKKAQLICFYAWYCWVSILWTLWRGCQWIYEALYTFFKWIIALLQGHDKRLSQQRLFRRGTYCKPRGKKIIEKLLTCMFTVAINSTKVTLGERIGLMRALCNVIFIYSIALMAYHAQVKFGPCVIMALN